MNIGAASTLVHNRVSSYLKAKTSFVSLVTCTHTYNDSDSHLNSGSCMWHSFAQQKREQIKIECAQIAKRRRSSFSSFQRLFGVSFSAILCLTVVRSSPNSVWKTLEITVINLTTS